MVNRVHPDRQVDTRWFSRSANPKHVAPKPSVLSPRLRSMTTDPDPPRPSRVSRTFDAEKQLREECLGLFHLSRDVPTLWHYTSTSALLGILESQELHLTCYRFLNDPGEGELAGHLVEKCWRSALNRVQEHPHLNVEYLRESIRVPTPRYHAASRSTTFTFSASTHPDSLSQWARYADDGAGVALGIAVDPTALERGLPGTGWSYGPFVSRVAYWEEEEEEVPSALVTQVSDMLHRFVMAAVYPTEVENNLLMLSELLAPLVKALPYREEGELRISASTDPTSINRYQMRSNRFGIAPGMALNLRDGGLSLTHLVLGPQLHPDNVWSAEWLKRKFDLPELEVRQSSLRYR
jgi:hypothetical protein